MGVGCSESKSMAATSSRSSRRCGVEERHRLLWQDQLETCSFKPKICHDRSYAEGADRANAARLSGVRARVEEVAAARARGRRVRAKEAMLLSTGRREE